MTELKSRDSIILPDAEIIKNPQYSCVNASAALKEWIAKIETSHFMAIDTETTGLDALVADIVGISLSVKSGEACYIPLNHVSGEIKADLLDFSENTPQIEQLDIKEVLTALKPI